MQAHETQSVLQSQSSLDTESDGNNEIEFVVSEITAVLSSQECRTLLFELANEVDAGSDLGQAIDWEKLNSDEIQQLVRAGVSASLCRALVLIINADKTVSSEELAFARKSMTPLIAIMKTNRCDLPIPDQIQTLEDFRACSRGLRDAPKELFSAGGVGGRASSLPRLCSLCDPFAETPLLPVFLYAVRRTCVLAASVDGINSEEQQVLESFDRLTEKCEIISKNVAARLPVPCTFESSVNSESSLLDISTQLRRFENEAQIRRKLLSNTHSRSRRISARIAKNARRNATYVRDGWNLSTLFLVFACLSMVAGISFITFSIWHSSLAGLLVLFTGSIGGVKFVVEKLLNLTWYSSRDMLAEQKLIGKTRFQLWKELSACDIEIERLDHLSIPLIAEAESRRKEELRQQAERTRRQAAISSYIPPRFGPIRVRSYRRRDGTYVQAHFRRR